MKTFTLFEAFVCGLLYNFVSVQMYKDLVETSTMQHPLIGHFQ